MDIAINDTYDKVIKDSLTFNPIDAENTGGLTPLLMVAGAEEGPIRAYVGTTKVVETCEYHEGEHVHLVLSNGNEECIALWWVMGVVELVPMEYELYAPEEEFVCDVHLKISNAPQYPMGHDVKFDVVIASEGGVH